MRARRPSGKKIGEALLYNFVNGDIEGPIIDRGYIDRFAAKGVHQADFGLVDEIIVLPLELFVWDLLDFHNQIS